MNTSYDTQSIPYHIILPWNWGYPDYYWVFYVLIVLSALGCLLNLVALVILLSKDSTKVVESSEARILILMLVVNDLGGSLAALVSSIGSVALSSWLGEAAGCLAFSFLMIFLAMGTLFTLNMMAIHLLNRLTKFKKVVLPLFRIYGIAYLLNFVLSFLVAIYPGDSKLYASGSNCIPTCTTPVFYICFSVIAVMLLNIVGVYVWIYRFYIRITQGAGGSEKKRKVFRRFTLFIGVSSITYAPVAIEFVYVWCTMLYPPPGLTIWVTLNFYLQNVLNPLLYFYTNEAAWKMLLYKVGWRSQVPTQTSERREDRSHTLTTN
eukprot:TRINITY_DN22866_c0_g1_i1.p1 TRINITY_DN22866_c0_g1~~TRINITY_DN22866_c0_g1_i1.p1  ORF type:complete len:320 (-),score=68.16 TRINITY_DN22866_c0_g1_i1:73-1032(-)